MTAHAMKGDRERCLAAGMDEYLTKPLDSRRLCALVEQMAPARAVRRRRASTPHDDVRSRCSRASAAIAQLLAEISRLFVDDAPRHLQNGSGRRSTPRDGESLRRAAHGLKGAAANFDADGVVNAARALEEIGRTGEPSTGTKPRGARSPPKRNAGHTLLASPTRDH